MTDNELTLAASYITALASKQNPNEKIKILLSHLLTSYRQKTDFLSTKYKRKKQFPLLLFSLKKIKCLKLSKEFITNGLLMSSNAKPANCLFL